MDVTLYNFSKRKNSTKRPSDDGSTFNCILKESTSIDNPSIIINFGFGNNPTAYSYAYIGDFGHYYYIRDWVNDGANWTAIMEVDDLATYKEDILSTSPVYVKYCSTNLNAGSMTNYSVQDPRVEISNEYEIVSNSKDFYDFEGTAGTYVLGFISQNTNVGPTSYAWLDKDEVAQLAGVLMSNGFLSWADIQKAFTDAKNAIVSLKYIPISRLDLDRTATKYEIYLGSYDTGITGANPLKIVNKTVTISIPWKYKTSTGSYTIAPDYRNSSKFVSMYLYLPAYGIVELNPDSFLQYGSIIIKAYIDGYTGELVYLVGPLLSSDVYCIGRYVTTLGEDFPISNNQQQKIGAIGQAVGGLTSIGLGVAGMTGAFATGGISAMAGASMIAGGTATLGGSLVKAKESHLGSTGAQGAFASIWANIDDEDTGKISLYLAYNKPTQSVTDLNDKYGYPVYRAVSNLSALAGKTTAQYVECSNFNVDSSAPDQHKDKINIALDTGIFIE